MRVNRHPANRWISRTLDAPGPYRPVGLIKRHLVSGRSKAYTPAPFTACRKRRHGRADADRHWRVLRHCFGWRTDPIHCSAAERKRCPGARARRGFGCSLRAGDHHPHARRDAIPVAAALPEHRRDRRRRRLRLCRDLPGDGLLNERNLRQWKDHHERPDHSRRGMRKIRKRSEGPFPRRMRGPFGTTGSPPRYGPHGREGPLPPPARHT